MFQLCMTLGQDGPGEALTPRRDEPYFAYEFRRKKGAMRSATPARTPTPDSPLGWALWHRNATTCRELAEAESTPFRRDMLLAIGEGLAGGRALPQTLYSRADGDAEISLAALHLTVVANMRSLDDQRAVEAVDRMRRLDHPNLPPVLRALIARDEARCVDLGNQRIEEAKALTARAELTMGAIASDPRLRIGLSVPLVWALISCHASERAKLLMHALRQESDADLQQAGCDRNRTEMEYHFRSGEFAEFLRQTAGKASDQSRFLVDPLLPLYLGALAAEDRIVELDRWLEAWRQRLNAHTGNAPALVNERHLHMGMGYMRAIMRCDFATARDFLRQRRASLDPRLSNPPRLMASALSIDLAERSTRRARSLLKRLDPEGDIPNRALDWCRLHLQEGNLTEAARRFLDIETSGALPCFRLLLAVSPDLTAQKMVDLLNEADRLRRQTALTRKIRPSSVAVPDLIGESACMRAVREAITLYAPLRQPTLIIGETGTGKDVIARLLHTASGDPSTPFLPLNCAAVPDSLAEAELFGHEAGSFTGATSARAGLIESAGKGTVFLDEVTSMPMRLQGILLRVLETGDFRRVGETRMRQSAARFIFASNEPLERAVADGRFREDLLYRLRRFVINAPPLRERPEDIPELCAHFIRLCTGSETIRPGPELLKKFQAYAWPGNVRELRNEIERIAILHPESEVLPANGFSPKESPIEAPASHQGTEARSDVLDGLPSTRARRQRILDLLRRKQRLHRAEVVTALGCSPATATRDLQELMDAGLIRRVETSGNLRTSYFTLSS